MDSRAFQIALVLPTCAILIVLEKCVFLKIVLETMLLSRTKIYYNNSTADCALTILHIMASLVPFLPEEWLNDLPITLTNMMTSVSSSLHGSILNVICGYLLPLLLGELSFAAVPISFLLELFNLCFVPILFLTSGGFLYSSPMFFLSVCDA